MSDFIYCGLILENDATVESIGLKNGSMILAQQKKEPEPIVTNKYVSEDCILQLTSAFKSFNETPAFRIALHVISTYCFKIYVISFVYHISKKIAQLNIFIYISAFKQETRSDREYNFLLSWIV